MGEAAHFEIADPGNSNIALFVRNNGPGIAMRVENQNTNFAALAMGVLGKSAFKGQVDILGPTGGPVPVNIKGNVGVTGNRTVSGGQICGSVCGPIKEFKIDQPLDPDNKYLKHANIESNEMGNIYSGTVVLDESGEAVLTLPPWFEALNRDFRYQLTCIGGFVPVYIAEEIVDNRFRIAGGRAGMKSLLAGHRCPAGCLRAGESAGSGIGQAGGRSRAVSESRTSPPARRKADRARPTAHPGWGRGRKTDG